MDTVLLIALVGIFLVDLLLTFRIMLRIAARLIMARRYIPMHANFIISKEENGRLHMRCTGCNCYIGNDHYNKYLIEF